MEAGAALVPVLVMEGDPFFWKVLVGYMFQNMLVNVHVSEKPEEHFITTIG